jgi:PhzF family phenazine biosynthesis protein
VRVPIYQLDAFTSQRFAGNPAAVMLMEDFPSDAVLQAIAEENNLAETAFIVPNGDDYRLRWFTPKVEVPLCGHATLASAAVVLERLSPSRRRVVFDTASGPPTVTRAEGGYVMNFPVRSTHAVAAPAGFADSIGADPLEVVWDGFNFLARLKDAGTVRCLAPDMSRIANLDSHGVIVTAHGDGVYDFVSRYFAPNKGIPEDPVTGGAHCALAHYWAARLGKTDFFAFQASARGGEITCRLLDDRVELEGTCVFYLEGEAEI